MTDLRKLAEAAKKHGEYIGRAQWHTPNPSRGGASIPNGPEMNFVAACSPEHILKLLEVVDKARAAMDSDEGNAMAFFGKLADLRTALQALDSSAIRGLEKDRTA